MTDLANNVDTVRVKVKMVNGPTVTFLSPVLGDSATNGANLAVSLKGVSILGVTQARLPHAERSELADADRHHDRRQLSVAAEVDDDAGQHPGAGQRAAQGRHHHHADLART